MKYKYNICRNCVDLYTYIESQFFKTKKKEVITKKVLYKKINISKYMPSII